MPTTTSPRALGRSLAVAAASVLLAMAGLLVASPAHAHDDLAGSDPAAGAALDALPAQLTLTFTGELASDPGATAIEVTDAAGTSLADGEPTVEGTVVTQTLAGAASGAITVAWKVVSSDGHPISGEFEFTVAAPPAPTPTATATATPTPTATPTADPAPAPTETTTPADGDNSAMPWIIGGLLLFAAVAGAIIYLVVSRIRRNQALSRGSGTPDASATEPSADR